ncbi:hypothetical protein D3C81_2110970 [compost metagenome]
MPMKKVRMIIMLKVLIRPGRIKAQSEFIMPISRITRKKGIIGALKIMVTIMPNMMGLRSRNSLRDSGYAITTENSILRKVPSTVI